MLLDSCTSLPGWIRSLEHHVSLHNIPGQLVRQHLQAAILDSDSQFDLVAAHVLQHFRRLPIVEGLQILPQLQIFIFAASFYDRWLNHILSVTVRINPKLFLKKIYAH